MESAKINLLHLEDSPVDCDLVRHILLESHIYHNLVRVDTSEEYSRALSEQHFDIILSDYTLPSFDGFAALDLASDKYPHVPFIFLTGTLSEELAVEALKRGAQDYVLKDNIIRLVPSIKRSIAEQKRREKLRKTEAKHKVLENQLIHAQKMESVGLLAAGIAHEINTPAQFVNTNLDFIQDAARNIIECMRQIRTIQENAPQEISFMIDRAFEKADWDYLADELPLAITESIEGTRRVSSIVMAMKEFSHPGDRRNKEAANLNAIINNTVTLARNEWRYVADVRLELDPQLPEIEIQSGQIGQVVLNMLVNAAHAISEKLGENPEGKKGIILIKTRAVGSGVEFSVEDTGNGIEVENRQHVFEPFFTTKKVGAGTGQGLAISHDVITNKHRGSINFETEVGKGTRFVIQLPEKNNNCFEPEC